MTATSANSRPLPLGQGKLSISRVASPPASSLNTAAIANSEPRRVPVPRHVSSPTPQYGHSYFDDDDDDDSWWKNVVREQIDVQTLRDMAKFFRTTEPPSLLTRASIETQRDCFGAAVTLDNPRRWSLQSLRRASRKSHRKSDDMSLRFKLPDNAVPSTTLGGHEYVAISLPRENGLKDVSHRNSIGLQLSSARPSARSGDLPTGNQSAWPRRIESLSSNGGSGPSTPTSSSSKARPSHLKDESSAQEEADPSSATSLDDRLSLTARDSSLRFYGTMLRLLGPSPVEEDENRNTPSGGPKETEESKTAVPPTDHSQPAQIPSNNQSEIRPATIRSAPSYSTMPKASISPKSSMYRHPGLHSRAGSSATTASRSTLHAREKSASHAHTKSPPPEKASQPSPPLQQKHAQSPRSPLREKVKPGSLDVTHATRLQVPLPASNLIPGSPGFPAMLAAMSFPSPPESSPPTTSHGGVFPFGNSMPQPSPLSSPVPDTPKAAPAKTSTDQSEAATEDSRNSMASVTSVMTDATATDVTSNATVTTADVKDDDDDDSRSCLTRQTSNSRTSISILDKKRARWSLLNEKPSFASLNDDDDVAAAVAERKRLSRLSRSSFASIESGSTNTISTSTSQAASALAERRAARRQKIKEKIQRDLTVSTTSKANRDSNSDLKGLAGPTASALSDAVDSPVLGYFPGSSTASTSSRVPGSRARLAQRSSIHRLAPLPDTSEEPHTQDDKEVAVDEVKQGDVSEGKEALPIQDAVSEQHTSAATPSSNLCMSPIMVAASIEPELPVSTTESSESEITTVRTSPTPTSSGSPSSSKADKRVRLTDKQTSVPVKFSKAGLIDRAQSRLSVDAAARPDMVQQLRRSLAPLLTSAGTDAANNPDSDQPSPLSASVGDTADSLLSSSDEHKWLQDHQRQSVQDWRQAAQRERERIQQLAAEERNAADARARKSPVPFKLAGARAELSRRESLLLRRRTTGGFDPAWSAVAKGDAACDVATTQDRDGALWQPHTRSSSLTTWRRPSSINPSRRFEQDFDPDRGTGKVRFYDDHHNTVMEQRVQRLERDRSDWVDVMMPLLENMNRLLGEICQGGNTPGGGLNNERAAALRDSMHVIRSMGADLGKHTGMGIAEQTDLAERVEEEQEEEDANISHAR